MKRVLIFLLIFIYSCENDHRNILVKKDLIDKLEGFSIVNCKLDWNRKQKWIKLVFHLIIRMRSFIIETIGVQIFQIFGPQNLNGVILILSLLRNPIWGSDDDTDIEYMYQELLLENNTLLLMKLR